MRLFKRSATVLFAACLGACTGAAAKGTAGVDSAARYVRQERTADAGTRIYTTLQRPVSSRTSRSGQLVRATVSSDVKDGHGHVVIPAGATVVYTIAHLRRADEAHGDAGEMALSLTRIAVDAKEYGASGDVESVPFHLQTQTIPVDAHRQVDVDGDAVADVVAPAMTSVVIVLTKALTIYR